MLYSLFFLRFANFVTQWFAKEQCRFIGAALLALHGKHSGTWFPCSVFGGKPSQPAQALLLHSLLFSSYLYADSSCMSVFFRSATDMRRHISLLLLGVALLQGDALVAQGVPVPVPPKRTIGNHYLARAEQPPLAPVLVRPASPPAPIIVEGKTALPNAIAPEQILIQKDSPTAWTFDQVIAATLTSDPRLRIGREDIRQAHAEYVTRSLLPNPELTIEGGALPYRRLGAGNYVGGPPELNVGVEFPIDWFLFAKRKAEMNSAQWEVRQTQAEYADLIRERIADTAIAFYDVLEAKAMQDIVQQDLELLTRLEIIAKDSVAGGGIPSVEWKRITLDLMQCRQELIETEKTLDILKARLRSNFGSTDYDPMFDITGSLDVPTVLDLMPLEAAFETARQNRPDIIALRMGVGKAKADVQMENRNAYPETTIGAGVGREYSTMMLEDKNYNNWGIGVTVTVPLFDRNQGGKMAARSALTQRNRQYQAGIVDLRAEVVEADRELRTAHQLSNVIATEEVRLSREIRDIMIEGFQAGGRPLIDVLDTERSYRETVRTFVASRADYWRALYTYNSVVGINSSGNLLAPAR